MKEIKKTLFKFTVYGEVTELVAPSMRQIKEFQDRTENEPKKELDHTIDFLIVLGMDKEKAWDLEGDHVKEIISKVCGKKNG